MSLQTHRARMCTSSTYSNKLKLFMWKRISNSDATQGQQKQAKSIAAFIVKNVEEKRRYQYP